MISKRCCRTAVKGAGTAFLYVVSQKKVLHLPAIIFQREQLHCLFFFSWWLATVINIKHRSIVV